MRRVTTKTQRHKEKFMQDLITAQSGSHNPAKCQFFADFHAHARACPRARAQGAAERGTGPCGECLDSSNAAISVHKIWRARPYLYRAIRARRMDFISKFLRRGSASIIEMNSRVSASRSLRALEMLQLPCCECVIDIASEDHRFSRGQGRDSRLV